MASYNNILTKGNKSALEQVPVDTDGFRFTQDTSELFIDSDGTRHQITDIVKGYTEEEIKSLLAPIPKIYLSSDTRKFFIYSSEQWIVIGKNEWYGTKEECELAIENGEILEGMTVYITDDYTGDGADLSIYSTNEYVDETFVQKTDVVNDLTSTDTDKPLSANQGRVLNNLITSISSSCIFSQVPSDGGSGWYRIAKYDGSSDSAGVVYKGAATNCCEIIIKRTYINNNSEYHNIQLMSVYGGSALIPTYNKSNQHIVTGIRHVVDTTNSIAYIELYLGLSSRNDYHIEIRSTSDTRNKWEVCDWERTEESINGITVYSQCTIPANSTGYTIKNLTTTEEGSALDATMGTQLKTELDKVGTYYGTSTYIMKKAATKAYGSESFTTAYMILSFFDSDNNYFIALVKYVNGTSYQTLAVLHASDGITAATSSSANVYGTYSPVGMGTIVGASANVLSVY